MLTVPLSSLTYTYDAYHNVLTATSATGVVYKFTYDTYGNNTEVSAGNILTAKAFYTGDGNYLSSTRDPLLRTTYYTYDEETGVLKNVQYPEDTASTSTNYT